MPYSMISELPEAVKKLPEHAQKIWMEACNAALKEYSDEGKAFATAWAAVEKAGYHKKGEVWVKSSEEDLVYKLSHGGELLKAAAEDGYKWRVRIIKSGVDLNKRNWSEEVLKANLDKFEGSKVFMLSEAQHSEKHPYGKPTLELVGWHKSVFYGEDGIYGDLVIVKNSRGKELRDTLVSSFDQGNPNFLGLSVDILGSAKQEQDILNVLNIHKVTVDVVYDPAAGGNFIKMAASQINKEINMTKEEEEKLVAQKKLLDEQQKAVEAQLLATKTLNDQLVKATEETNRLLSATKIDSLLRESQLPDPISEKLKASWKGKLVSDDEIKASIKIEKEVLDKIIASTIFGAGITVTKEDRDKRIAMFDDFFEGKVQSFKACYINYTGDENLTGNKKDCRRLLASMDSTSLSLVLQDSMNKKMVKEYGTSAYNKDWRKICTVVPRFDFRTNHITRMGGYGDMPTVAEGAAYTAATSPTDEEATYAMLKRGYTEDITFEMLRNDDVKAIRKIPIKVANACARQLYEFVFAFLADNPTIYDSAALFTSAKGNYGTVALDLTQLNVRRRAMVAQTELSSGKRLGIPAKFLIVPTALDKTAYDLIYPPGRSDFAPTTPEYTRTLNMELIINNIWTDATNWFLSADPALIDGLEIGFLDGRENPEFFVQDHESVGTVFTHDKITYKWRHIYNGAITDYRQFDGSIVAG